MESRRHSPPLAGEGQGWGHSMQKVELYSQTTKTSCGFFFTLYCVSNVKELLSFFFMKLLFRRITPPLPLPSEERGTAAAMNSVGTPLPSQGRGRGGVCCKAFYCRPGVAGIANLGPEGPRLRVEPSDDVGITPPLIIAEQTDRPTVRLGVVAHVRVATGEVQEPSVGRIGRILSSRPEVTVRTNLTRGRSS